MSGPLLAERVSLGGGRSATVILRRTPGASLVQSPIAALPVRSLPAILGGESGEGDGSRPRQSKNATPETAHAQGTRLTKDDGAFFLRLDQSVARDLRWLMTKVLLSPSLAQGPGGTSLKSTNFQSVTSVSCEAEIIAHRRRDIEPGATVEVRLGPLVSEDVFPMIGAKRARILPLRVDGAVAFADRDPAAFANRDARSAIGFLEPRHDPGRLRPMTFARLVVVGQRAIKRVLPRGEFYRDVVLAMRRVRIVVAAVVFRPGRVPTAGVIRDRVIRGRIFADPENRRDNALFPWGNGRRPFRD